MIDQLPSIKRRFSAEISIDAHTAPDIIRMLEVCADAVRSQLDDVQRQRRAATDAAAADCDIHTAAASGDTEQCSHLVSVAFNPAMTPQAFEDAVLKWMHEVDADAADAPKAVQPLDGKEFPIATAESFAARPETVFEATETLGATEDEDA